MSAVQSRNKRESMLRRKGSAKDAEEEMEDLLDDADADDRDQGNPDDEDQEESDEEDDDDEFPLGDMDDLSIRDMQREYGRFNINVAYSMEKSQATKETLQIAKILNNLAKKDVDQARALIASLSTWSRVVDEQLIEKKVEEARERPLAELESATLKIVEAQTRGVCFIDMVDAAGKFPGVDYSVENGLELSYNNNEAVAKLNVTSDGMLYWTGAEQFVKAASGNEYEYWTTGDPVLDYFALGFCQFYNVSQTGGKVTRKGLRLDVKVKTRNILAKFYPTLDPANVKAKQVRLMSSLYGVIYKKLHGKECVSFSGNALPTVINLMGKLKESVVMRIKEAMLSVNAHCNSLRSVQLSLDLIGRNSPEVMALRKEVGKPADLYKTAVNCAISVAGNKTDYSYSHLRNRDWACVAGVNDPGYADLPLGLGDEILQYGEVVHMVSDSVRNWSLAKKSMDAGNKWLGTEVGPSAREISLPIDQVDHPRDALLLIDFAPMVAKVPKGSNALLARNELATQHYKKLRLDGWEGDILALLYPVQDKDGMSVAHIKDLLTREGFWYTFHSSGSCGGGFYVYATRAKRDKAYKLTGEKPASMVDRMARVGVAVLAKEMGAAAMSTGLIFPVVPPDFVPFVEVRPSEVENEDDYEDMFDKDELDPGDQSKQDDDELPTEPSAEGTHDSAPEKVEKPKSPSKQQKPLKAPSKVSPPAPKKKKKSKRKGSAMKPGILEFT